MAKFKSLNNQIKIYLGKGALNTRAFKNGIFFLEKQNSEKAAVHHIGIKQKDENDKIEAGLENLANELSWIDCVTKYSEKFDLDTSLEQKQREFLKALLKKIIVKSEYAIVRKKD